MPNEPLRIAFMGTPDFALEALRRTYNTKHSVTCVYSQPPRPKGRGHKVQPSPVHAFADEHKIPIFTPTSLKSTEEQKRFAAHDIDVAVVAAYGLILPKAVLEAPRFGCINIHASLLPRWRGASPIQHAIWYGDDESGVTLMQMDEGLDTGPMIAKCNLPLTTETTASSLHDDLAQMGGEMIVEALDQIAQNQAPLPSETQDEKRTSYAPLLKKNDGVIDWTQTARQIHAQIRALNPWPGVTSDLGDTRFKILNTRPVPTDEQEPPGTILDKHGAIMCSNKTALKIETLQPAGKKPMDITAAINGGYLKPGDKFS